MQEAPVYVRKMAVISFKPLRVNISSYVEEIRAIQPAMYFATRITMAILNKYYGKMFSSSHLSSR